MKGTVVRLLLMFCLAVALGCSSDRKAEELLETARFEEKQHNLEHATKLYEQIVQQYPGSEPEKQAAARLAELKVGRP